MFSELNFFFGLGSILLAIVAGWFSGRIFKTKTIREIVETATATIDLYEQREKALEDKIDLLEKKIDILQASLQAALAKNDALQTLLMQLGGSRVPVPVRVSVPQPEKST